jgi:hypothetical protein
MMPKIFKVLQFACALLVLMEGVRQLDTGYYFPWFYFITGVVMLTLVPALPVLNSKYYVTGAVIYVAEAIVLFVIAWHYWDDMRKYGAILNASAGLLLCIAAIRNFRKS